MTKSGLGLALRTMLALGASQLALGSAAYAQQFAEYQSQADTEQVLVRGRRPTGVDRLPQPIEDQPQSVHVIDSEMLQQQAVTTLDQAVRNIPGITANTGEGGGAVAGDQFRIRGFDAANDIASDGLRDFGVYTRDAFNVESVQVFLGPSGATFGRGSFGGAINTTSKFARADDFGVVQGVVGNADLLRATLDVNREIGDTTAVRLNLMAHQSGVADIDVVESQRWGASAGITFGLGSDTTAQALYFHQTDNRVPYFGVPVSTPTGQLGRPLPVDRSNFYGTEHDHDDTQADVVTFKIGHQASDWLQIRNDTRIGVFAREFQTTAPGCNTACVDAVLIGAPAIVTRGAPSGPYFLNQWGVQNITTAIADFDAGGLTHQFVAGLDFSFEASERANSSAFNGGTFPRPNTDAYNPSPVWSNPAFVITNERESESTNYALFASEQVWFTEQLSVLAGIRADRYEAESDLTTFGAVNATTGVFTPASPNTVARTELEETLYSPRVSLVWEPGDNNIVYLSWARSAQPATGTAIASVGTPITAGQEDLEPTTSETIELGARFGVFDDDLTLGVSVFQTERDNSKETDPTTGGIVSSGDEQQVTGVELSASGEITSDWVITASYTYLDSETQFASAACVAAAGPLQCPTGVAVGTAIPNPNAIGNPIPFAAEHAATLWTTYTPTDRLTLGLGARYTDEVWLNNTNTAIAPHYLSVDGLISYEINESMLVSVNGANLLDREDNYDQVVGGRAAHSPGRTFMVSLAKSF